MDEKLFQQIVEVNYLTTGNAWRYRAILRFFYIQHERLRHYLFPEEIYDYLKQSHFFQDYSLEQLQQDLSQLVEWKNLIPRQDMGKVSTIEERMEPAVYKSVQGKGDTIEKAVFVIENSGVYSEILDAFQETCFPPLVCTHGRSI